MGGYGPLNPHIGGRTCEGKDPLLSIIKMVTKAIIPIIKHPKIITLTIGI
jgi:hypothetical protein